MSLRNKLLSISFASVLALMLIAVRVEMATPAVDYQLMQVLRSAGFTGNVESTLAVRLGRPINIQLANLGRLLWLDKAGGLHSDNTCGGCHSPANGFGDSQSIAIGVQNNNVVGQNRAGPRNQRRTPSAVNTAFYPNLMWNGRFASLSGNPFDNSKGFIFPLPEGTSRFPPNDPIVTHLLIAQAHIPPTEFVPDLSATICSVVSIRGSGRADRFHNVRTSDRGIRIYSRFRQRAS